MSTTALIASFGAGGVGVVTFGASYVVYLGTFSKWIQYFLFEICLTASTIWISWGCNKNNSGIKEVGFCVKCLIELLITLLIQIFCVDLDHVIDAYYGLVFIFLANFISTFIYYKESSLTKKLKMLMKGLVSSENSKRDIYELRDDGNQIWFWVLVPVSIWMFISWKWIDIAILLSLMYPITMSMTLVLGIIKQPHIIFSKEIQSHVMNWYSHIMYIVVVMMFYIPLVQIVIELERYIIVEFCLSLIPAFLLWKSKTTIDVSNTVDSTNKTLAIKAKSSPIQSFSVNTNISKDFNQSISSLTILMPNDPQEIFITNITENLPDKNDWKPEIF